MKRTLISLLLILPALLAWSDITHLLPKPKQITSKGGDVMFRSLAVNTPVYGQQFNEWLEESGIKPDNDAYASLTVTLVDSIKGLNINPAESYTLSVQPTGISITATAPEGVYWALQTLRQLSEGNRLPAVDIADEPAFRVRGLLRDLGRTYTPVSQMKKEIELLSRFKINVYHLHLTENQAWRLESKAYPQLNDSATMERQPGMYYTQDEMRELDEFARQHNVMLLPEIDMPGHSAAFKRAMGVDMQSEEGIKILKTLIDEACDVFSAPYIHIGTDEVAFTNPDFVPQMVAQVRSNGKKAISWNPGWRYAPGEIDMTQMWSYRGKAQPGIPAIDCRYHYLNHFDTFADLVSLYRSNVYGHSVGSPDIAGSIVAIWNDRYVPTEEQIIIDNGLYPHTLALAERTWCGGGDGYFDSIGTMMPDEDTESFKEFADFERRLLWHKDNTLADQPIGYVKQSNVRWRITDAFPNGGDLTAVFPPETEGMQNEYTYADSTYHTRKANGAGIYLRHVWGPSLVPGFYENPQPDHTAYAFTRVYSPVDQEAGLQFETQNYSRSEPDIAPLPGKWDYRESHIWVNGKDIEPPVWTANREVRSNENPLGNENLTSRQPVKVNLKKGWNDVMIKLPVGKFSTPETRLVKWMFSAVFTTPDGKEALPGIEYSADIPTQSF